MSDPDHPLNAGGLLLGRFLLASLFLVEGWGKMRGYAGAVGYMEKFGVPGALLPVVIFLEIAGGLAILVGFQTQLVALALAGFSVAAALIFHNNFADRNQMLHFEKDLAIAGGFLMLFAFGPGAWSLDKRRSYRA